MIWIVETKTHRELPWHPLALGSIHETRDEARRQIRMLQAYSSRKTSYRARQYAAVRNRSSQKGKI